MDTFKALILSVAFAFVVACAPREAKNLADNTSADVAVGQFDYIIGTQTFGARYGFTAEPRLVETAECIAAMGSNIIKFSLNPTKEDTDMAAMKGWSPLKIARESTTIRKVLEMDFKYTLLWVTTPGVNWGDGMSSEEKKLEYDSMYELTKYLLTRFKGSGRSFYLGHWEGDWLLLGNYDDTVPGVDPVRAQGMVDWFNARHKAIADARASLESDVKVYSYAEVNKAAQTLLKGYDRMANKVLPFIDIDYVSYSSYESIASKDPATLRSDLFKSLAFIESCLKPRSDISGRRVFLGEFGFNLKSPGNTALVQAERTRNVLRAAIEWGCPFALFWEMYDNEGDDCGFWMIDSHNVKQPVWYLYRDYYAAMQRFVREYVSANGSAPSDAAFRDEASSWLESYRIRSE